MQRTHKKGSKHPGHSLVTPHTSPVPPTPASVESKGHDHHHCLHPYAHPITTLTILYNSFLFTYILGNKRQVSWYERMTDRSSNGAPGCFSNLNIESSQRHLSVILDTHHVCIHYTNNNYEQLEEKIQPLSTHTMMGAHHRSKVLRLLRGGLGLGLLVVIAVAAVISATAATTTTTTTTPTATATTSSTSTPTAIPSSPPA